MRRAPHPAAATAHRSTRRACWLVAIVSVALALSAAGWSRAALGSSLPVPPAGGFAASGHARESAGHRRASIMKRIRIWTIHYRAHDGARRKAYVVLPAWYGPRRHTRIPLIISPHGRGLDGLDNARLWGNLPALGRFAVVNPDGQGRLLANYSWGYAGQIDDLARMPQIVTRALPWLQLDRHQTYAFGGSMGGQEILLLIARHPGLLAGAAAFDSVTDLALQYRYFPRLACNRKCRRRQQHPLGIALQTMARHEIGGSPRQRPAAYRSRSPITYSRALAASGVPLQLWWSVADKVVINQSEQSGRLFWRIRELNRNAPVMALVGFWVHSAEMRARSRLPYALATFGLLPERFLQLRPGLRVVEPPR